MTVIKIKTYDTCAPDDRFRVGLMEAPVVAEVESAILRDDLDLGRSALAAADVLMAFMRGADLASGWRTFSPETWAAVDALARCASGHGDQLTGALAAAAMWRAHRHRAPVGDDSGRGRGMAAVDSMLRALSSDVWWELLAEGVGAVGWEGAFEEAVAERRRLNGAPSDRRAPEAVRLAKTRPLMIERNGTLVMFKGRDARMCADCCARYDGVPGTPIAPGTGYFCSFCNQSFCTPKSGQGRP